MINWSPAKQPIKPYPYQNEAVGILGSKKVALLGAMPGYGKTYVGTYLMRTINYCRIMVVFCGFDVKDEWIRVAHEDGYLYVYDNINTVDWESLNGEDSYFFYVSTQKGCRFDKNASMEELLQLEDENLLDEDTKSSQLQLIKFILKYKEEVGFVFDECHFSERTRRTQKVVCECLDEAAYKLYISATPYTSSLTKANRFEAEYTYTLKQCMEDFLAGLYPQKPVMPKLYTLDGVLTRVDDNESENWAEVFSGQDLLIKALVKILRFTNTLGDHNVQIFCADSKDAKRIVQVLGAVSEQLDKPIRYKNVCGNSCRDTSKSICDWLEKDSTSINLIITCKRFGTGSSIYPLQADVFMKPITSPIAFIQNAMRCCRPYPNKEYGHIIVPSKFGAFKMWDFWAHKELGIPRNKMLSKANHEAAKKYLPFWLEENQGLREISYEEATNLDNLFVVGSRDSILPGLMEIAGTADLLFRCASAEDRDQPTLDTGSGMKGSGCANGKKISKEVQRARDKKVKSFTEVYVDVLKKTCEEGTGKYVINTISKSDQVSTKQSDLSATDIKQEAIVGINQQQPTSLTGNIEQDVNNYLPEASEEEKKEVADLVRSTLEKEQPDVDPEKLYSQSVTAAFVNCVQNQYLTGNLDFIDGQIIYNSSALSEIIATCSTFKREEGFQLLVDNYEEHIRKILNDLKVQLGVKCESRVA